MIKLAGRGVQEKLSVAAKHAFGFGSLSATFSANQQHASHSAIVNYLQAVWYAGTIYDRTAKRQVHTITSSHVGSVK